MSASEVNTLPIPVTDQDHVRGAPEPMVTLVKYGDYECPDCHKTNRVLHKALIQALDRVRYVYRHFPLHKVHPRALRAAEAAEAAAAQGRFWEMHDLLFPHPEKLADDDLRSYAKRIGLEIKRFDRELNEGAYSGQILRSYEQSIIHGVTGTPTFYVDGVRYNMG